MNPLPLVSLPKLKLFFDSLWAMACLVCVPTLIGMTVYWVSGMGGVATVISRATTEIHAAAGDVAHVDSNLSVQVSGTGTTYRMELVDDTGKTVVNYPEVMSPTETPEFGNLMIKVPQTLPVGDYRLFADIKYVINPLKTNSLRVKVATITIDGE